MIRLRLRELLARREESLAQLARATGLSYSTLHRIHSGRAKRIDLATLDALCAYFELGPEEFFEWQNGELPPEEADIDEKLRRWPEILASTREHLKRMEEKHGILPDSTELIREEREKRSDYLAGF